MDRRQASCCCGQCEIELSREPLLNVACHCDNCKKRTGSALGISVYFAEADVIRIDGETRKYQLSNELGGQRRHFCSRCGTTLYWYADFLPKLIGVAGGCLTGTLPTPSFNAMDSNQYDWVRLADCVNAPFTADDIPRL